MIAAKLNNLRRYQNDQNQARARNEQQVQLAKAKMPKASPSPSSPAPVSLGSFTQNETMPWDTQYETVLSGINTGLANTDAALANDENALRLDYGVSQDGKTLDPTNAFSKAALLQRSFQQNQAGNTNSYAARGQLYSGALQNAQDQGVFNNQVAQDQLLKGYQAGVRGIIERRQAAQAAAEQAKAQAGWDRLATAQSAPAQPAPNAAQLFTQAGGGSMSNLKLTAKGLFRLNPATGKYDIPVIG